jgi:hypothetical protein
MKTSTTQPLSLPVRLTRSLRTPLWKKTVSSGLLAQFALWSVQVKGEAWTQTGAGPFTWTMAAKWTPASSAIVAMGNNVFQCLFSTLRA